MTRLPSKLRRCLVALLASVAGLGVVTPLTSSASTVGALEVHVMGSFANVVQSPSVLGVVEGVTAHGVVGRKFEFYVTCTRGNVPVTCHQVTWNLGDNTVASGDTVLHGYTRSGTFNVSATVDGGLGVGQLSVLVVPMYSDAQQGPYAQAIWALESVGLDVACTDGRYCPSPSASAGPSEDIMTSLVTRVKPGAKSVQLSSVAGIWVGQSLTLGGASVIVTSVLKNVVSVNTAFTQGATAGSAAILFPALASTPVNGVTGQSCFSTPGACGLDATYFVHGVCTASCQTRLANLGIVSAGATHELVYNPTNCASGYVATKLRSGWVVGPGEPAGCETKGAFLALIVSLAGGVGAAKKSPCVDATGIIVREAVALGLGKYLATNGKCNLNGPIAKLRAYDMLAALGVKVNAAAAGSFTDIANSPAQGVIGGLLARGTPLVGSGTCSSGKGTCFNTGEALTKGEAAQLIASDLLGGARVSGGTSVRSNVIGGDVQAMVSLAKGEAPSSIDVSITVGNSHCSASIFVGVGGNSTGCHVGVATVGREAVITASGGWGVGSYSMYIAPGA
jgi:hypothetical protein